MLKIQIITPNFSLVLYGSETWFLIYRKRDSLGRVGVIEEIVLRKIFWYNKEVRKNKNIPLLNSYNEYFLKLNLIYNLCVPKYKG